MYYPDLTQYEYGLSLKNSGLLNVGWLSKEHPYPQGETIAEFKAKLLELCEIPVNQTRGFHRCEFCEENRGKRIVVHLDDNKLTLGSAEIRAVHADRSVFAAPNMIYHYVVKHNYLPPDKFIEAVIGI